MDFHVQYGGSARDTYARIKDAAWPTIIRKTAQKLTRAIIIDALYSEPETFPVNVSHTLFSAFPLTDTDRRQFRFAPTSTWALQEILARLNDHVDFARKELFDICNDSPPPPPPVPVPCVDFDPAQPPSVLKVGVYYRPLTRSFATFDSFYVDSPGHAIGFQASIGSTHDAKESGVEWLKDRGIDHVTYVYVSPVQDGGREAKVMIPVDMKFDYVYHMQIPF
ncbi:hypothetical protein B0H19DRAFT_203257 [Mycena capillaripes]|nr:hypothetical protein B0H19DRAFT_203257 [Mycena capillaripes]